MGSRLPFLVHFERANAPRCLSSFTSNAPTLPAGLPHSLRTRQRSRLPFLVHFERNRSSRLPFFIHFERTKGSRLPFLVHFERPRAPGCFFFVRFERPRASGCFFFIHFERPRASGCFFFVRFDRPRAPGCFFFVRFDRPRASGCSSSFASIGHGLPDALPRSLQSATGFRMLFLVSSIGQKVPDAFSSYTLNKDSNVERLLRSSGAASVAQRRFHRPPDVRSACPRLFPGFGHGLC